MTITKLVRTWKRDLDPSDQAILDPYSKQINMDCSEEAEIMRSFLALDWLCRSYTPTWLRAAGLVEVAMEIEQCKAITDRESREEATPALDNAANSATVPWTNGSRVITFAANKMARHTARDAVWGCAVDALRGGVEARGAAWNACEKAGEAAVRNVNGDISALEPTIRQLQQSGLELLEQMIVVGPEVQASAFPLSQKLLDSPKVDFDHLLQALSEIKAVRSSKFGQQIGFIAHTFNEFQATPSEREIIKSLL